MNDDKNDKSKVDALSDSLYSRTKYKGPEDKRSVLGEKSNLNVDNDWNSPDIDQMLRQERRKPEKHSTLHKVFYVAVLFFICAIAVSGYIFLKGGNYVSSKNVEITVSGPVNVNAGEPLELGVTVINKNNADLESATLYVQYPEGTRDSEDSTLPLTRAREVLGEIKAGRKSTYTMRSILFGEKGEIKQIKITIEYKVKGSNATFSKEKLYDIGIGNTPVSLNLDLPTTVTSGDTFKTKLTILANSSEILKNVIIRGEYPYGYSVSSSIPEVSQGNNVWLLGDLSPGDKKTITIDGRLTGQDDEERTFRFYAGVASSKDVKTFDTPLTFVSETLPIRRPGLGLEVKINSGNSESAVAPAGKVITSTIEYKNNLSQNLENVRIEALITGSALDKSSVRPLGGGFYDSTTNKIVWDRTNYDRLEVLAPDDRGLVSLSFASLIEGASTNQNQQINLNVTITGTPQGENSALSVTESRLIKIASEIALTGKSLFTRGPFKNTGPIPPQAEKTTTYTLVFNVRNTQNDISNGKVTAVLGSNVKWLGKTSPSSENITFDESRKIVTWNIGTLASGSGFDAVGREGVFQVALTPSIGQIGSAPLLASEIVFSGTDAFTGESVSTKAESITTRISSDPSYVQGNERVVK